MINNYEIFIVLSFNEYEHIKGDFQMHYCTFKGDK